MIRTPQRLNAFHSELKILEIEVVPVARGFLRFASLCGDAPWFICHCEEQ
jgi:hypothetical protein